jgi:LysR family nitrogen assimilation transcriptional regulator
VTYPDISLEIDEHMAANYGASHLLNDRMDLSVLLNDESLASEIVSTPFLHERFWFVRKRDDGAPLPRSVTLDTVVEYPLILTTRTTSFRAVIARQFAQFNLKPTVAAESNSGQTIASMVADGVGASLLPYSVFGPSPRAAELEYCPVEPAFFRIATLAHVKAAPLSMACESVRALMYELATRMIHAGEWPGASMSRRG